MRKPRTSLNGATEELNGGVLIRERGVWLVVKPSELLQDLCMVRVLGQHLLIGLLGLRIFFLLLVDMADLEEDVRLGQGHRGVVSDVAKALKKGRKEAFEKKKEKGKGEKWKKKWKKKEPRGWCHISAAACI